MTEGHTEPLQVGEIRHVVFTDHDGQPWLCRLRLASLSPKGHRARWEPIDSAEPTRLLVTDGGGHPPVSAPEAIEDYQRLCIGWNPFSRDPTPAAEYVRRILRAERLKARLIERSDAVPIHAVASSG